MVWLVTMLTLPRLILAAAAWQLPARPIDHVSPTTTASLPACSPMESWRFVCV